MRAGNTNEIRYDDAQASIGRVSFPGVSDPTFRLYDHGIGSGVTFDVLGFSVNDTISFDIETFHSMKLDTILNIHMHFILPNTTNIGDKFQFQLDVIVAGINGEYAVPAGSPFTAEHTIVANDDSFHRIFDLANIPSSNTTISTIYTCRLTRITASESEYGSEVYLKFIDGHYQIDDRGSQLATSK